MVPASFEITSLHEAYRAGLDPAHVVEAAFRRAGDHSGIFISFVDEEAARASTTVLGPFDPVAKPLWGIPFAVKDNIDVAGLATTAACPGYSYVAKETATCVRRLTEAGAILVGKTNLDQFATGLVGVRSPYPIPKNAFDSTIVPGGSSSGSAIAVARGIVTFALGTDTAGSGRVPAGLNNLVGLKPTLGAVPVRGVVPACKTLDCVSIFALTVPNAWTALKAMAGPDPQDPWSKPVALDALTTVPATTQIGIPDRRSRRFYGDSLAERAFEAALADIARLGMAVLEIDLSPFFEVADLLYEGPWVAERYQAIRDFVETSPNALHPTTRKIIEGARRLSAADAFAGFYRLAELRAATHATWRMIDALIVPTLPRPYSLADLEADPITPNTRLGAYTNFVNLLDLCAIAVPARFREDNFPSGVTCIAPAGHDAFAASVAALLHAAADLPLGATGIHALEAPALTARALPGEIEIVVVGAHLSGMPLNHELTDLGARFLREAFTTADYRLYALQGDPPKRPGLVRVAPSTGAAIATEVWALPAEGFGRFVASVPAPLCIGAIILSDDTKPKGFLCEPVALERSEDISAWGGWRAFTRSAAA